MEAQKDTKQEKLDRKNANDERKSSVAILSVAANTFFLILKIVVGFLSGSVSVLSEGIHSGIDLVAAVIAYVAVRVSSRPPDEDHPFGYGKVENVSGTLEAALILCAGVWIIYESGKKLFHPEPLEQIGWGIAVMLLSSVSNWLVSARLFAVARETDSVALEADAWHLRTDVYTSAGVMAGLMVIWVGGIVSPGTDLRWLDPVVAIGVALLILHAAYELTVQASVDLFDVSLPPEEVTVLREHIARFATRVLGIHKMRTRKAGASRFIEFHMVVEPLLLTKDSHEITSVISHWIKERFPGSIVTIHVEPCEGDCPPKCVKGCFLTEEGRKQAQETAALDPESVPFSPS